LRDSNAFTNEAWIEGRTKPSALKARIRI
jgi:hypothetical protein